jgi:hypothetical protein
MAETPTGGSLHRLLQDLREVGCGALFPPPRPRGAPGSRHLRTLAHAASTTARALVLVAMPLLAMAAGNALLFAGQGQEFLREFVDQVDEVSPFQALLSAKFWWLAGVSAWALAVWYCALRLLSRLYARGPHPPWVQRWEDLLRGYLPRLLLLACLVPVSLTIGRLAAPATARPPLLLPHAALLLGSMLAMEVLLDGHRAPRRFNQVVGGLALGLLLLAVQRASGGWASPALWAYFGIATSVLVALALLVGVPALQRRRAWWLALATGACGAGLALAGVWRLGAGSSWLPTAAMGGTLLVHALVGWRLELGGREARQRCAPPPAATEPQPALTGGQLRVMVSWIGASFALAALFQAAPITVGRALGAPSIALLALGSLCLFFSLALVLLPRTLGWPSLVVPALVSAFAVAYLDPYRPLAGLALRTGPETRPELAAHFAQWRQRRAADGPDAPVIVVAAEGGGVRAAVWTALALARLDDATCGAFGRRVYAISSVSGGSLGAAFYVAQRAGAMAGPTLTASPASPASFASSAPPAPPAPHAPPVAPSSAPAMPATPSAPAETPSAAASHPCGTEGSRASAQALRFFRQDFISPVLGAYLFADLMRQFPVANFLPGGRGPVLEGTWEHDWAAVPGRGDAASANRFAQPFLDLYRGHALHELPLLFLNATTVEDGKRAIAAPVRAAHVDAFDLFHENLATAGLKLSTAVHNSARFPFVSPAGFIEQRAGDVPSTALKPWGRVVDGGYFENAGAVTAREIVEQLAAAQGGRRDNLHVLILSNAPRNPYERLCHEILQDASAPPPLCRADPTKGDAPENAALPDLSAPVHTLLATREARGSLAKAELAQAIGDAPRVHELYLSKWSRAYDDPPLGWFLSGAGITGIDDALSAQPKSVKELQPARLALQRLAWRLVMPGPYSPSDDAATLAKKRLRFLCERGGGKDCAKEGT